MRITLILPVIVLLGACGQEMTPEQIVEMERARWQHTSIPENVAGNPKWRALLPPSATYHPYPGLQMRDSWSVPDSIHDVVAFYRKTMPQEGFMSERLVECLDKSIWGGAASWGGRRPISVTDASKKASSKRTFNRTEIVFTSVEN